MAEYDERSTRRDRQRRDSGQIASRNQMYGHQGEAVYTGFSNRPLDVQSRRDDRILARILDDDEFEDDFEDELEDTQTVESTFVQSEIVAANYLDAGEGEIANTENISEEKAEAERAIANEVLAGALQGDFNNDPTFWSDIGQIVTGLIPIAGQLGDARDLIHALDDIFNKEGFKKIASWATLVLIVIGFIPGVGDAIKSLGRRGIRYLDNNGIIKRIGQWLGSNVISPILERVGDITAPLVSRIKNAIKGKLDDTHQIARQVYDSAVWEKIDPTASVVRGTEIPATFNVSAGEQQFWVNANGSEHMAEYVLSRDLNNLHPYNMELINQIVLTQFQAAVETAVQQGIKYDEMMVVGNYELIFRPARQEGLNPVISHARYVGGQM